MLILILTYTVNCIIIYMQLLLFFQDVCNSTGAKIKVNFFNEESQEEAQWFIAMETSMSTRSLLESIREPWEAAFGVGMEIVQADFDEGSQVMYLQLVLVSPELPWFLKGMFIYKVQIFVCTYTCNSF